MRQFKGGVAKYEWFEVKFSEHWRGQKLTDLWDELPEMFNNVLNETSASHTDLVRVHIRHKTLSKGDIKVRLQPCGQMNGNTIMTRIEEVMQSNDSLGIDDSFKVGIGVIRLPSGT